MYRCSMVGMIFLSMMLMGAGPGEFRVVGYLPDYRMDRFDPKTCEIVTDLTYFSVEPSGDGGLDKRRLKPESLVTLRKLKAQYPVRLILSVGGWGRSARFAEVATSPALRTKFATELVKFCEENHFDGVDLDWEHPKGAGQVRDHGLMLTEIRQQFKSHGYLLTMAVAGWQSLSPESVAAVDWFNLMAYDADGRHSTFEFAQNDVARLAKQGVPASKICLGLPFYGRDIKNRSRERTYADLIRNLKSNDVDEVDGFYFNSIATIEKKTKFAMEEAKLAGVMIWELGQDSRDDRSLLTAIGKTIRQMIK